MSVSLRDAFSDFQVVPTSSTFLSLLPTFLLGRSRNQSQREPETVNFGNDWPMWLCDYGWHEWYSLVNGAATFPSWMKMQLSVITMEWTAHCGSSENLWPPHSNRSFWIPILQTRRKWVLEGTVEHRIKFPHFEHLQVNFPQVRLLYLTQILQFDIFQDWPWKARVFKSIMNSISPSPSL